MTDTEPTALVTVPASPLAIIAAAVERGADPDQLSRLLDLKERSDLTEAIKAFGDALAAFQAECPFVEKWRVVMNKDKTTQRYKFANYEDVLEVARPFLAKNRISVSFTAPTTAERFEMTMRIQVGSYFVDKPYSAPMPDMAKLAAALFLTEPQAFGVALSYHRRFCFCLGLDMVVKDEDIDAAGAMDTLIESELHQLRTLIAEKGVDLDRFLAWANVTEMADILRKDYPKALDTLQRRKAGAK